MTSLPRSSIASRPCAERNRTHPSEQVQFTHHRGHTVGQAPTQDNLIVFYLPNQLEWQQAIERMKKMGYEPVKSYNPYWDNNDVTFEDPDGYRVVLQNADWNM